MENDELDWLHPSLRASFVPLPADPSIELTKEQLDALFPPENRVAWRDVIELTLKKHNLRLRDERSQAESEDNPDIA